MPYRLAVRPKSPAAAVAETAAVDAAPDTTVDPDEAEWAGDLFDGEPSDPEQAFARFKGENDEEAWLDRAPDGTLTGWVRDMDGKVYRYSDVDAWAVDVDDAGMTRDDEDSEENEPENAEKPGKAPDSKPEPLDMFPDKPTRGEMPRPDRMARKTPEFRLEIKAKDSKKPYGDVTYADPGYQKDKQKRYPIDTEAHVRAAWSYVNQKQNAAKYNPRDLARIKKRIRAAARKFGIDISEPSS